MRIHFVFSILFSTKVQKKNSPDYDDVFCFLIRLQLFGWWKIPQDERQQPKKGDASNTANTLVFTECLFPPSCLGAANPLLFERYPEAKNATTYNIGAMSSCNVPLGFNATSRLCHTCTSGYRRQGSNRCSKCPEAGANWGLILLGGLVILLVLAFIVIDTISEAGEEHLSASLQKIILNYLQVATLFGSFPLRYGYVLMPSVCCL